MRNYLVAFALILVGCGSDEDPHPSLDPDFPPVTTGSWYRPAVNTTWQWQLQGALNISYDVDVYDIDLFDAPQQTIDDLHTANRFALCYFSAGSWEDFRSDAGEFEDRDLGNELDGFADERWLDIRSPSVAELMRKRLDFAVTRGCDAVEPDNVQAFDESTGFDFTANDQLAFNRMLANEARTRGMGVALKNDLGQISDLLAYFDLALNEQCAEFDECAPLGAFVADGKPVFEAEYSSLFVGDSAARDAMCTDALAQDFRALVLPADLDDSFRFTCD